ncbi:MAG: hypothetical protein K0R88_1105 [Solirubrobacterales bacterium]|jgi:hypothetical protein|nr:hypothetical protein [Solirubrobacterales bacterium]
MREDLLESEAIEMPATGDATEAQPARPLPARREQRGDLSVWRGEVRTAALAAAGGLVAGAATVAVVRATRGGSGRRPGKRSRGRERPVKVVASRSFLVDVHLLGDQ